MELSLAFCQRQFAALVVEATLRDLDKDAICLSLTVGALLACRIPPALRARVGVAGATP
jgi:hypothetical protein